MRLLPAHQVYVAHGSPRIAGKRRRPDQACSSVAEQIGGYDVGKVVHPREDTQDAWLAPTIARLIKVEVNPVAVQVDDVGRPAAIDIGQANTILVELVWVIEMRCVVHGNLSTKSAVAKVGPVTDLPVVDAH